MVSRTDIRDYFMVSKVVIIFDRQLLDIWFVK